jgi:hypothetical protein
MLRGSPEAVSEYNAAQPLPVVGGVTKQELAALGCKLRQQQQDEAVGVAGQVLESVDEDGVYNRQQQQQQQQYVQRSGKSGADTAAVRDSGNGGKPFWGMLRHRSGSQQQQQQPGHARSLSFSEGVATEGSTQQQQQQHPLGPRPVSDNSGHAYNSHNGNSSSSSSNGLSFKPLVQLSGYFDIVSSKLQSARSFGRSVPTFPSVTSEWLYSATQVLHGGTVCCLNVPLPLPFLKR